MQAPPTTLGNKSNSRWWLAPIVLLGSLLSLQLVMVHLAVSDESFAVERDYYQQATRWDRHQAELQASRALGWRLEPRAMRVGQDSVLRVRVLDGAHRPVSGADVRLRAFANARAGQSIETVMLAAAGDAYEATLPGARRGLWQLHFSVQRGTQHFVERAKLELD